jgi:hypothetical protein
MKPFFLLRKIVLVALLLLPYGHRHALVVNRSMTDASTLEMPLQAWVNGVTWEHRVRGVKWIREVDRVLSLHLEPSAVAFLHLD